MGLCDISAAKQGYTWKKKAKKVILAIDGQQQ
jgi:hypothetical protein